MHFPKKIYRRFESNRDRGWNPFMVCLIPSLGALAYRFEMNNICKS